VKPGQLPTLVSCSARRVDRPRSRSGAAGEGRVPEHPLRGRRRRRRARLDWPFDHSPRAGDYRAPEAGGGHASTCRHARV